MPTIRISESIEVMRPIGVVFDAATDPEEWVRREAGLQVEVATPLRVGTPIRMALELKGHTQRSEGAVTEFEYARRFAARMPGEPFDVEVHLEFEGNETSTKLTVDAEVDPTSRAFALSMFVGHRLMERWFRKMLRLKLAEFKAALEA